ncbi:beta-glucosidase [Sphaerisporangium krabiense]|uniref:Beta-glucosidase n=1 Tax=Sphaerisporangium krabiense TaxID=763782 RepID=A0A7W9DQY8_9ACTN|nr:GH1 family beta-glucosidase [Sphaerisporangium krabiense]MBB5627878.1 beta-glucosidase [Sphaerisporangium krabiense]GII62037.1 beta-glucosidase [Sphaerisporangium krabiense]
MFLWGTATASYQIEGAVADDGRGLSIWDTFAHEPGKVKDGHTGDMACDHYHRWSEDVMLMAALGVNSYRFSISWPRILPAGRGAVNQAGLDFYDRLVDGLCAQGIVPAATLFHWDLPQALEDEGGWLARDTASRLADYAGVVAARLADRVPIWITLNEPFVHMVFGYALGTHAPGRTLFLDALPVAHHQLLGHGLAAQALRAHGAQRVLVTNNLTPVRPASSSTGDLRAADAYDTLHNRLFNDPVLLGRYPDLSAFGVDAMPAVRDGDLAVIAQPLDGLGVNYYNPTRIRAPGEPMGLPFEDAGITGHPTTAFGWPVVPDGLRELLTGLKARYGDALPPVYVTENGCSQPDIPGPDGVIDDQDRIAFLDAHIQAVGAAMSEGVDVRGYYVWSLLDNFEWAEGYTQRFGLVHVDFPTQKRTPKASYHWLRTRITTSPTP